MQSGTTENGCSFGVRLILLFPTTNSTYLIYCAFVQLCAQALENAAYYNLRKGGGGGFYVCSIACTDIVTTEKQYAKYKRGQDV
jgi:hypothetical protein